MYCIKMSCQFAVFVSSLTNSGVQQVRHQGETCRGLVTDGVYIARQWLPLLNSPCLNGLPGQD